MVQNVINVPGCLEIQETNAINQLAGRTGARHDLFRFSSMERTPPPPVFSILIQGKTVRTHWSILEKHVLDFTKMSVFCEKILECSVPISGCSPAGRLCAGLQYYFFCSFETYSLRQKYR